MHELSLYTVHQQDDFRIRIGKDTDGTCRRLFMAISQIFLSGIEKKHNKKGQRSSEPRFKLGTAQIRNRNARHLITTFCQYVLVLTCFLHQALQVLSERSMKISHVSFTHFVQNIFTIFLFITFASPVSASNSDNQYRTESINLIFQ